MIEAKHPNSLSKPVSQGSMVGMVIERIKEALVNKELVPGDALPPEMELARNLGVGKSTIREAVKMLQALGVLEVRRGQGTFIRETLGEGIVNPLVFQLLIEKRPQQDIVDLRMLLEPAYTLMAMQRATAAEIQEIGRTIDRLEESIKQGNPSAEDDLAFHRAILQATKNPFVIRIGETVLQLFQSSITTSMRTIPEVALRDHKRIYQAFKSGDEAALTAAVVDSFQGWKQSLQIEDES